MVILFICTILGHIIGELDTTKDNEPKSTSQKYNSETSIIGETNLNKLPYRQQNNETIVETATPAQRATQKHPTQNTETSGSKIRNANAKHTLYNEDYQDNLMDEKGIDSTFLFTLHRSMCILLQ